MAGNCRPDGVGGEVKITIGEVYINYLKDKEDLVNGVLDTAIYQNAVLMDPGNYFIFTVNQRCSIWAITGKHIDSGKNETNKPARLYRILEGNKEELLGDYPTVDFSLGRKYDQWYKLFDKLEPGTYKVGLVEWYIGFQELYGEYLDNKLYVKADGGVYGMVEHVFSRLSADWNTLTDVEKKALFLSTSCETTSTEDLATLGEFKVLTYSETEDKPNISLTVVPKDRLILPKLYIPIDSFKNIDKTTITSSMSGNGVCKIIVTMDMKAYNTYNFDTETWSVIDHTDLTTVKTAGIDAARFADIDRVGWNKLLKDKSGVGFAYLMAIDAIEDQCVIDKLTMLVNRKGDWV